MYFLCLYALHIIYVVFLLKKIGIRQINKRCSKIDSIFKKKENIKKKNIFHS